MSIYLSLDEPHDYIKKSDFLIYDAPQSTKGTGFIGFRCCSCANFCIDWAVCLCDNVVNDVIVNVTDTIDLYTETSTTVGYKIAGTGGDGQTGCNVADGSSGTVTIGAPSGVTASPGSLTFTACNVFQNVTFSSSTVGDYDITVSVSDSGAGSYSTTSAKFTLQVIDTTPLPPPQTDNTAPTTIASLDPSSPDGENDWYVSPVEVTLTAEDDLGGSGIASTTYEIDDGSTETYIGPFTVSDDGEHVVTFRSEDNEGNVEIDQTIEFKIDQTKPYNIAFEGGSITDGGSYYFDFVPDGPTG